MDLHPIAVRWLRWLDQFLEIRGSGGPSAEQDLEVIRFYVYAVPGLHRGRMLVSISTAESGLNLGGG